MLCKETCLPPTGITSGQLAPWILWFIWLARNDHIFNNKDATPESIITKAMAAAREWLSEQSPLQSAPTPAAHHLELHRRGDETLIQTDAAWRGDLQLAGLGWMMKTGDDKSSFSAHCHFVNSPLIAEGLALREALISCVEKGIHNVRCESDSLKLIKALNKGPPMAEIYGIAADINCLSSAFDSISFVWIKRCKISDALAKQTLWDESLVMAPPNLGADHSGTRSFITTKPD